MKENLNEQALKSKFLEAQKIGNYSTANLVMGVLVSLQAGDVIKDKVRKIGIQDMAE